MENLVNNLSLGLLDQNTKPLQIPEYKIQHEYTLTLLLNGSQRKCAQCNDNANCTEKNLFMLCHHTRRPLGRALHATNACWLLILVLCNCVPIGFVFGTLQFVVVLYFGVL